MNPIRSREWAALMLGVVLFASCGGDTMHRGRLPFTLMERAPRAGTSAKVAARGEPQALREIGGHDGGEVPEDLERQLQFGDVVTFYMSHDEALGALSKGKIQKLPYELFQYGHLALVVPDPHGRRGKRLLQVAMKEAVNADEGLDYLDGKRWRLFRPPTGSIDDDRLGEFARLACQRAHDPKRAYDYAGVLGWKNAPWRPGEAEEVGDRFSCATLVVAGLWYSGFELDAVHRGGRLDIVTPRQVVSSRGWRR